jgi:hypothetical protein
MTRTLFTSVHVYHSYASCGQSPYVTTFRIVPTRLKRTPTPRKNLHEQDHCDRTTSEMRGLSPKIISEDSRWSENAQTHTHKKTVPNMKFNLKLLQIKCHVLGFTTDKAQKVLQRIIRVFVEVFVSHDRHTLFALEESEPPRMTYTCESQ